MPINPPLRLSLLPIDIIADDWAANIEAAKSQLAALPYGTDIAVLPELFSTGFVRNHDRAESMAHDAWPHAMTMLQQMTSDNNCAVAGSMMYATPDSHSIFNRAFFIEPGGECSVYDKRHLFAMGAEAEVFTGGHMPSPIIRFRGWNIALAICYDLRFPAWIRNNGLKYDLLLVPANWPDSRAFAWKLLLQARALENQAYVAGANRSGKDRMGSYTDLSYVCDYTGQMLHCVKSGIRLDCSISKSDLAGFRGHFPFWKDADHIMISD